MVFHIAALNKAALIAPAFVVGSFLIFVGFCQAHFECTVLLKRVLLNMIDLTPVAKWRCHRNPLFLRFFSFLTIWRPESQQTLNKTEQAEFQAEGNLKLFEFKYSNCFRS